MPCWEKTETFGPEAVICSKCGKPPQGSSKSVNCIDCKQHQYDRARAVGIYADALKAAVIALKSQPRIPSKLRSALWTAFEQNEFDEATLIIPVPLSKQRAMERGYNQSEVIAEFLSKRSRIPTDSFSLVRTKHSPIHRAGMDEKARDLSVQNSFNVLRAKLIAGQRVLLVDDVLTTGATVSYCAKTLKRAGAIEVNVLTIARAV
jgi:ComF family protein